MNFNDNLIDFLFYVILLHNKLFSSIEPIFAIGTKLIMIYAVIPHVNSQLSTQ